MNAILVVGPCFNKKYPSDAGGDIVLFEEFIKDLFELNIKFFLIDTNPSNYFNLKVLRNINAFFKIMLNVNRVEHITLHTTGNYQYLFPYIFLFAKLFKKSTSIRMFGSTLLNRINRPFFKWLTIFSIENCDFLFVESKSLREEVLKYNSSTYWFPNVRGHATKYIKDKRLSKSFVFVGRIIKEKGIDLILQASKILNDFKFDFYGHFGSDDYTPHHFEAKNVNYKGAVKPGEVINILHQYDALLLPTFYKGEGYPGVIIEAYAAGIPVIATNWRYIGEVVKNNETGILFKVNDLRGMIEAIKSFNENNYKNFVKNVHKEYDNYNSMKQTKIFLKKIKAI